MSSWNEAYAALNLLCEYVDAMKIDWFALPEQGVRHINIVLVHAHDLCDCTEECLEGYDWKLPRLLTLNKGETFFRMRREYSAVKMWQGFRPNLRRYRIAVPTIRRVADIPPHMGMRARGWELIVAQGVGGIHTGDDVHAIDVVHPLGGLIECKIGGGRFYTAAE